MITKTNIESVIKVLGFKKTGKKKLFTKTYQDSNTTMSVDIANKKLIYPTSIKGRERNSSFDKNENFVVFECIDRLLTKGYKPEHIELEKEWSLGRLKKSGRSDICIKKPVNNDDSSVYLIIECKTFGKEFNRELKNLKSDGGQLFSYWQQEDSCKWLCLYASNFDDEKISYNSCEINCSDDKNIELLSQKDNTYLLFKNAGNAEKKYQVWKETYNLACTNNLIFSPDSIVYNIEIKPLKKKDLKEFSKSTGIVNDFAEILRHNNVSDKENAFNRLVALFICKLVDELTKNDNDVVEFQYLPGKDTYESLQDRLQRLHKEGMSKFMKEDIFYVPSEYANDLFQNYTGQNRQNAIDDLNATIRCLKFYSNNDFAFKDVHNEELFYQNGKVLVEVVQLFEKYKIVYSSKHQFLGDMFEQLLNQGFKQNEGQFFTPIPIVRFIWDSLPLEKIVKTDKGTVYPRVIDYACGAGHFLTEAVEAINANILNNQDSDNSWARDSIYGIEKDYRLARVSKISLFMNGAGEGNILFADGLENNLDKGVKENSFDILVANPPYSIKDFKQHLKLTTTNFTLLDKISKNSSSIETLFVERLVQLLKPKGIAAVILPATILTNNQSYEFARKLLIENCYIRAIVSLGASTFGKTGQKTVILFLEKFNEPPKNYKLCKDSVAAIFSNNKLQNWDDNEILKLYLQKIEMTLNDYSAFLKHECSIDELKDSKYFKFYVTEFEKSQEKKKLKNSKHFVNANNNKQQNLILESLYSYIDSIEKTKLYIFSLVFKQKTMIINSPEKKEALKNFLGYTWSERKGQEGIVVSKMGGQLFDEKNRFANNTLAWLIRNSFLEKQVTIPQDLEQYAYWVDTKDLFNFSGAGFNVSINTKLVKTLTSTSIFPMISLENYAEPQKGTSITKEETQPGEVKVVAGGIDFAYTHNTPNRSKNIITISASGANAGFVNFWDEEIFASDCTTIQAKTASTTKFLYFYLLTMQDEIFDKLQKGSAQPHVYPKDIAKIPIPQVPVDLQKEIVQRCNELEEEHQKTMQAIGVNSAKIDNLFKALDQLSRTSKMNFSLSDSNKFELSIGKRVLKKELVQDGQIPIFSANVQEPFGFFTKLPKSITFEKPSILWGIDGDWMTNCIEADEPFYPTDHCGVLKILTNEINPRYMRHLLEIEGQKQGFSREYRAAIERVKQITFSVTSRIEQDNSINQILEFENNNRQLNIELSTLKNQICKVVRQKLKMKE